MEVRRDGWEELASEASSRESRAGGMVYLGGMVLERCTEVQSSEQWEGGRGLTNWAATYADKRMDPWA
jgi:hypothetical protein